MLLLGCLRRWLLGLLRRWWLSEAILSGRSEIKLLRRLVWITERIAVHRTLHKAVHHPGEIAHLAQALQLVLS